MDTLDYIAQKYNLKLDTKRMPIEIPNVGRNDLAKLFAELGFKIGVEVGVECGVFTEVLCRANPQAKIYGVDAWKAYAGYRDHVSQIKLEGFFGIATQRTASFNCELIRKFSLDAVKEFPRDLLDFVYIDGNHELPFVMNDIIEWSRRVRPGGVISGHDYYKSTRFDKKNHTVFAVNCYTEAYQVRPWFLLGTKAEREGEVRDGDRSWMWVRQ